ncbi:hypothetical protein V5P93_001586 [Actinokineospora auranticolor]|uniref:hypothetical protein n=1 Tax=Actinokineospora auranticolor TaxID=155976 RepID=UPI000CEC6B1B|nr:hypothetical protein [Actinokineospora auranticolor]
MSFRWRYEDETGGSVTGPGVEFATQDEAEEWFGGAWRELGSAGVAQVVLLDGDTEVYGPMSLSAAE